MKPLVAVLSILVALLALAWWKRDTSARASLETAGAEQTAVSNKLAEANMRLTHQEQLAAVVRSGLEDRARQLAALSNAVAALKSDLARARADSVAAQHRARDSQSRASAAEAQAAGLTGKLEELTAQLRDLNAELEQSRSNAVQLESARAALANEAECLKIEKVELARQLNDEDALRLRLRRLRAGVQPLELHPDGSVGIAPKPQPVFRDLTNQPGR